MTAFRSIAAAGDLAFALPSFLAYRAVRWALRRVQLVHYRVHAADGYRWRLLAGDTFRHPLALPIVMTSGPRWNTHAVVASVGPLRVSRSLGIDAEAARRSAGSWTLVASTFPDLRVAASLGSLDASPAGTGSELLLPEGAYWIALRYYEPAPRIELPALALDGRPAVAPVVFEGNPNAFYRELEGRESLFYLCLHYYVYVLLRHGRRLPRALVEREYLPVGNPETRFFYGALRRGEALDLELAPGVLQHHGVYLTLYNRASFPVASARITACHYRSAPAPRPLTYLLRVVRVHVRRAAADPLAGGAVKLRTLPR